MKFRPDSTKASTTVRLSPRQSSAVTAGQGKYLLRQIAFLVGLLCILIAGIGVTATFLNTGNAEAGSDSATEHPAEPDHKSASRGDDAGRSKTKFPVSIRKPAGPPRVDTGLIDLHGEPVMAACSTCHSTRPPNPLNRTSKDLDEFHGGMAFSHGAVSCLSCHNDQDYDTLKLADGRRIEFTDVMTLCAQCHGPQMTAYQHGAHGGMTGHWDLTRGPQVKNNCIDCHNPHAPQFPKMQPTFKPRDRFLDQPRTEH